jgi:ADP-ribosyl-[dinitrogen reductase] hydrolase
MRTSLSSPLEIAAVSAPDLPGLVGLTLCPGKKDRAGAWDRDLAADLGRIRQWGAAVVVTLVEERELGWLGVADIGAAVGRHGMGWRHLPIRDGDVPRGDFEASWTTVGAELRALVREGGRVLINCRGGLGRAGMISARLLVELGMDPNAAIVVVRRARPGAIETAAQEDHVRRCRPIAEGQASDAG